jgi:hypothetical protein
MVIVEDEPMPFIVYQFVINDGLVEPNPILEFILYLVKFVYV